MSTRTDGRSRRTPRRPVAGTPAARRPRPTFRENVRFWVQAIVIILVLRAFLFEPFRIPSESMENTLLVGDFLIVSKVHYGARTPSTVGIPFTRFYLPGVELPQVRLPGVAAPRRGDVAVFNYPSGVDVERGRIPEAVPVERRAPYIKRLVGMPGDTLSVTDKLLRINGADVPLGATLKQRWRARATAPVAAADLARLGVEGLDPAFSADGPPGTFDVYATPPEAQALLALAAVAEVRPYAMPVGAPQSMVYPQGSGWNADQYGPVVIPARGMTVALTPESWPVYAEVIARYERRAVTASPEGALLVDGQPATAYTFTQDYYFAMGDFRDNSVDSRFWGFVPADHLVGKAVFTFLSFRSFVPPIPRLERFFRPIP